MSERKTPETDKKQWDADLGNMVVDADFARSLERQRDAAVEALRVLLASDPTGAIANASDDDLSAAINDPEADAIVKGQASSILQARAVLAEIEGK